MNSNVPKQQQERLVLIHTQRWSNLGLAIAFFFTAFFTLLLINTNIPTWWNNITDSIIVSILLELFLFIPVGFLLIACIIANEHFNSVNIRIWLLIGFSFLASIFIVFIFCPLSDLHKICSTYSLGVFVFYTLFVMFALMAVDTVLLPVMQISLPIFFIPSFKTIISLPMVFVIWRVTQVGWVWIIPILIFIIYFFYYHKTSMTWAKLKKYYVGDFSYKCTMHARPIIINMFRFDNYKEFGLYLSFYNFLPNIFLVLNETVSHAEMVNDPMEEEQKKREQNVLSVLYDDNLASEEVFFHYGNISRYYDEVNRLSKVLQSKAIYRIIKGLALYIVLCFILSWMGNLFEGLSILMYLKP